MYKHIYIYIFACTQHIHKHRRPRGPMDKASAYGAGDCRFESCRGHRHTYTYKHMRIYTYMHMVLASVVV